MLGVNLDFEYVDELDGELSEEDKKRLVIAEDVVSKGVDSKGYLGVVSELDLEDVGFTDEEVATLDSIFNLEDE